MVPFDDALINGPLDGLGEAHRRVEEVAAAGANAVLGFRGLHRAYTVLGVRVPFVENLTASTIHRDHARKSLVGSVESALAAGCDAVAVHVNVSAQPEPEMLATLGRVGADCDRWGMPMLAIMYPRREHADGTDDNYGTWRASDRQRYTAMVAHCVRVGVDLGADVVKTQYTGDVQSFATVIAVAMGVPVVVAGGPKVPVAEAVDMAYGAVTAGAAGVCFGRNTYNRSDVSGFVRALVEVVHHGRDPGQVLDGGRRVVPAAR
jgi:DhnA family fructose-bisphosphate aldolase class Ia